MSALPPALGPWSQQLELFKPALAQLLGAWLPPLQAALDRFQEGPPTPGDELDGLGGISRRGPPHRLLLSEWALAELAPDEFLRRAAMNEQLYAEPSYRGEAPTRRVLVVLDTGPGCLGAPRLAQLAALAAMDRRAMQSGGRVAFGSMCSPELEIIEGLEASSLLAFMALRSFRVPPPDAAARWAKRLPGFIDGLWVCGEGRWSSPSPPGWLRLELGETDEKQLSARLLRGSSPLLQLRLPLPDDSKLAALIKDPLGDRPAPPPPVAAPSSQRIPNPWLFHFIALGNRLMLGMTSGALFAPLVAENKAYRRKHVRRSNADPNRVLAAGWFNKHLLIAERYDDELRLYTTNQNHLLGMRLPPGRGPQPRPGVRVPTLCGSHLWGGKPRKALLWLDNKGALWRLCTQPAPELTVFPDPVEALAEDAYFGIVWLSKGKVYRADELKSLEDVFVPPDQAPPEDSFPRAALFGPLRRFETNSGLILQKSVLDYEIFRCTQMHMAPKKLTLKPRAMLAGLTCDKDGEAALVLYNDRCLLQRPEGGELWLPSAGRVMAATCAPMGGVVAWLEHPHTLVVHHLDNKKDLLRVTTEAL